MIILAIGAHPDDIEIYAGGTLIRYVQDGHTVKLCVVTSGNLGHNEYTSEELAAIRKAEATESAKKLGVEIKFLGFDERLEDNNKTRDAIINIIRWANPDVILTHYPDDASIDHAIVGTIVKQSLLCLKWKNKETEYPPIHKSPAIFFWEPNGGINFQPEQYVDITDVFEKKKELLACHKSQIELEQDYMGAMQVMSAFRGLQSKTKYAEGFKAHNSFENPPNYKLLP